MYQTLLAFLAMLILSSFALNQQRALMLAHRQAYSRESEMVALDLALKRFAAVERLHFDEAVAGPVPNPMDVPFGQLTPSSDLGPDGGGVNDIDDFHRVALQDQEHTLNGETHPFRWRTQVRYVDSADRGAKEVIVDVYRPDADPTHPEREKRYVQLRRVYTLEGMIMQ